jgi:hypothetical protein
MWLSPLGTPFSFCARIPVSSPDTVANRSLSTRFPAAILKNALGKIQQASYQDVWVVRHTGEIFSLLQEDGHSLFQEDANLIISDDGQRILASQVNANGDAVNFYWPDMPVGRHHVSLYYGHASCSAPATPTLGTLNAGVFCGDTNREVTAAQAAAFVPDIQFASVHDKVGVSYVWGKDIEAIRITNVDTGSGVGNTYGGELSVWGAGYTGGDRYRSLIKYFEGALPKGSVVSATLYMYLTSRTGATSSEYSLHKLETYGYKNYPDNQESRQADHHTLVSSGWAIDARSSYPTWNTRMMDYSNNLADTPIAWETPGVFDPAGNICKSTAEDPTVNWGTATSLGWVSLSLPPAWLEDQQGADFSQGFLFKKTEETGSAAVVSFTRPSSTTPPLLMVEYGELLPDQLKQMPKLTTNRAFNATATGLDRYTHTPSEDAMGVAFCLSANGRVNVFAVDISGQAWQMYRELQPTGGYDLQGLFGAYFDPVSCVYFICGVTTNGYLALGRSAQYRPVDWTWKIITTLGFTPIKSVAYPVDDVVYFWGGNGSSVKWWTFDWESDTLSTPETVIEGAFTGTLRGLAASIADSDVMTEASPGTISANGSIDSYPDWGSLRIGSEIFFYTGKSGTTFTGVERAQIGTTAANHAAAAQIGIDDTQVTYEALDFDPTRSLFHAVALRNVYAYVRPYYVRKYLTDDPGVWRDEQDTILTLPLTQSYSSTFGNPGRQNFIDSVLCHQASGDFLVLLRSAKHSSISQWDVAAWDRMQVWRLPATTNSWSAVELDNLFAGQLGQIGATDRILLVATDISATGDWNTIYRIVSPDRGASFGASLAIAHMTPPVSGSGLGTGSLTQLGSFEGRGLTMPLMGASGATYGALYLLSVDFQTVVNAATALAVAAGIPASINPVLIVEAVTATAIAAGVPATVAYGVAISDAGTGSDSVAPGARVETTHSGTGTHDWVLEFRKRFSETGVGVHTAAAAAEKRLSDTGSGSETTAAAVFKILSDAGAGDEVVTGLASFMLTHSGTGTEAVRLVLAKVLSDVGVGTDTIEIAGGIKYTLTLSDAGTGSEAFAYFIQKVGHRWFYPYRPRRRTAARPLPYRRSRNFTHRSK